MKRWAKILALVGLVFYVATSAAWIWLSESAYLLSPSVFFEALCAGDIQYILFILFRLALLLGFVVVLCARMKSAAFFRKVFLWTGVGFLAAQLFAGVQLVLGYLPAVRSGQGRWADLAPSLVGYLNSVGVLLTCGVLFLVLFDRVDSGRAASPALPEKPADKP